LFLKGKIVSLFNEHNAAAYNSFPHALRMHCAELLDKKPSFALGRALFAFAFIIVPKTWRTTFRKRVTCPALGNVTEGLSLT
jgi:hypothetical protein